MIMLESRKEKLEATLELFSKGVDENSCILNLYGREISWIKKEYPDIHIEKLGTPTDGFLQRCKLTRNN